MRLMRTPRSVDLEITDRCNLRCRYCSHFGSEAEVGRDLPTEEWLRFFEELGRCAVMDVCLQGGEPFIRDDLAELIRGIVRNRMRFSLLSNGTLITDEVASLLAETGRCSSVQVSIDGSVAEVHDSFRGEGTFRQALEGLQCLQRHGLAATVRVTIHRRNVHDLDAIAALLLDEIGLPGFSTNNASHMGLCRKNADQVELTADEHTVAMESLLRLNERYNGRISAQAGPLANARMWLEMEEARATGAGPLPHRGHLTSCGGVFSKMAVLADGTMVACGQLAHVKLGRINQDRLDEVWQHHPELQRLRERPLIPLSDFEFCQGCPYLDYCPGGCPALSYTTAGDVYHPSADACLRRFLEEGGRLPLRAEA
jgi:SynChlorMet cassette radical SAM/SPASM protein ScmE